MSGAGCSEAWLSHVLWEPCGPERCSFPRSNVEQASEGAPVILRFGIARQVAEATGGVPGNAERIAETLDDLVTRHGSPNDYGPDYWRDYQAWAVPVIRGDG